MIPGSIKIPVPNEYVFPSGALFLGVDKLVDWDKPRDEDNQARDESGVRVWVVKVSDQDPEAGKFGRSNEVKVKVSSAYQPMPPAGIELPGGITVRPVEFVGLTATPYADTNPCKGTSKPHKCRARLAWSYRADEMVAPGSATASTSVAASAKRADAA
jgi:hypothetical protein